MDYDEHSLNSMPTMADPNGAPRRAEPQNSHSTDSARTMGGRTVPPHGRFRPGDVLLGRYTVLSELGEGGMGVVYKCLDTIGGIEVAIKCLPPELSRNESEMEGIRENYAIVARLHHSAISGLRQLEKDSEFGEYYLVMDLAKGEDLSTILRRRRGVPMPLDEALAILRPLASALDYAHGEHVLHRDVKPANVKVDGSRVQLLDFGLAAEVRSSMSRVSLRGHAGSSGTPAYMAPEQWEARRQSATTDQYSLAVMAYEMLSGYRPFDTDNMELLKSAVLTRAPEEIEGLPAHVNAALQKALAKNPKERFASCAEFVESCVGRADLRVGHEVTGGPRFVAAETTHGGRDGARPSPASAVSEADVLRRKLALTRSLKAIPAEDREDSEFAKFVGKAEDELAVAEEACKFGRFAVAAESLNVAEKALYDLQAAKQARNEAERKAREEAERKAREEAERKVREEAERKAREEAARRAWKEARRKAKEEVREEAERKAREEAARWDRDKIERMERDQVATDRKTILMTFFAIAALIIGIGWYFLSRHNRDGAMQVNLDASEKTGALISTSQASAPVVPPAAHPVAFRQEVETSHKETAERSNDDTSSNTLIVHKQTSPHGTIRMITEATFPPYEFRQGKEIVGIDVEICKAIAKELGKKLEIEDVEFDSLLPSVIAGKAELAAAGITITEDRKKQVDFSIPYYRTGIVFVYAMNNPFEKGKDAKGKKVGVQNGTTSSDYVRMYLGQEPKLFDSPASTFAALKAGKVDVMIADIEPARAVVKGQVGYAISNLLTVEEYAVAIKKGQPELLATINKVIQRLRDSGELDKITDDMTAKANTMAAAEAE